MPHDDLRWIKELRFNYHKITDSYWRAFLWFFLLSLISSTCLFFVKMHFILGYILIGVSIGSVICMCIIFWHIMRINIHLEKEINERLGIKR